MLQDLAENKSKSKVGIKSWSIVPAMMVANYWLDRVVIAGKCMIVILFPYFLLQWSIPTLFFKFIIFKISSS